LINEKRPVEVWLTAYEIDKELWEISRQVLDIASREAEKNRIKIHWQVFQDDFILARLPEQQPSIFRCLKTNHI
jgi:hypothetical protein